MWKKFITAMALVAVFTTSTSFALVVNPEVQSQGLIVESNASLTSATLDPSRGQTVNVSFNLNQDAKVWGSLVNKSTQQSYQLFAAQNLKAVNNPAEAIIRGTTNNSSTGAVLPEGSYTVEIHAATNAEEDIATATLEIRTLSVTAGAPEVRNFDVTPSTFDAKNGEAASIDFDITEDGFITVSIINPSTNHTVRTFDDYLGRRSTFYTTSDNLALTWDGRDDSDDVVADGNYTVRVAVENNEGTNEYEENVRVSTQSISSGGVISKVTLDPSSNWDPAREEMEINLDLNKDIRRLLIRFENGNEVIEVADDDFVDSRDYSVFFDGVDDDGDYLREGNWKLVIWADADRVEVPVTVKYEDQEIIESFVSKESFDTSEDEFTSLVLKSGVNSNVTVEVYKGNQREVTLAKDVELRKNRYYAFKWDGTDRDGDEVTFGANWRFKITAENQADNDIFATEFVDIDVEEDTVSDNKSNITNDFISPVVLDKDLDDVVSINFCIDEDADVTMDIFDNFSTSGTEDANIFDEVPFEAGCHEFEWNGLDEKNKKLKDGVYTYKIVTKAGSNRRETEIGHFAIGNLGVVGKNTPVKPPVIVEPPIVPPTYDNCGGYYDTKSLDSETCAAIEWATQEGIFNGNPDGSFRPYEPVNRAEALKTVLLATDANLLPANGSTQGFSDVDAYDWYMTYVRTAATDGFLNGVQTPFGKQAQLTRTINRVEFLKLALEAASRYKGLNIPQSSFSAYSDVDPSNSAHQWFLKYASMAYNYLLLDEHYNSQTGQYSLGINDVVQRREVALVLYRMNNSGLLSGGANYYGY